MKIARRYVPTHGDLLAFSGESPVSRSIRSWTCSRYSHAAIVVTLRAGDLYRAAAEAEAAGRTLHWDPIVATRWRDGPRVIESTTMVGEPCDLMGFAFNGVQAHRARSRILDYDGRVWVLRLKGMLTAVEQAHLRRLALEKIGTLYDAGGAILAGTIVAKNRWLVRRAANRSTLFCVEFVESLLFEAMPARPWPAWHPGRDTPRDFVRRLVRSGLVHRPRLIHDSRQPCWLRRTLRALARRGRKGQA